MRIWPALTSCVAAISRTVGSCRMLGVSELLNIEPGLPEERGFRLRTIISGVTSFRSWNLTLSVLSTNSYPSSWGNTKFQNYIIPQINAAILCTSVCPRKFKVQAGCPKVFIDLKTSNVIPKSLNKIAKYGCKHQLVTKPHVTKKLPSGWSQVLVPRGCKLQVSTPTRQW